MTEINPKPIKKSSEVVAKGETANANEKTSVLRWLMGWILGPGLVIALLVGAGVYVGANHANSWITRAVMWVVNLL